MWSEKDHRIHMCWSIRPAHAQALEDRWIQMRQPQPAEIYRDPELEQSVTERLCPQCFTFELGTK